MKPSVGRKRPGCPPPLDLIWGPSRARGAVPVERLSKIERIATPIAFRDILISLARGCR